jgi:hypothetical protein
MLTKLQGLVLLEKICKLKKKINYLIGTRTRYLLANSSSTICGTACHQVALVKEFDLPEMHRIAPRSRIAGKQLFFPYTIRVLGFPCLSW